MHFVIRWHAHTQNRKIGRDISDPWAGHFVAAKKTIVSKILSIFPHLYSMVKRFIRKINQIMSQLNSFPYDFEKSQLNQIWWGKEIFTVNSFINSSSAQLKNGVWQVFIWQRKRLFMNLRGCWGFLTGDLKDGISFDFIDHVPRC